MRIILEIMSNHATTGKDVCVCMHTYVEYRVALAFFKIHIHTYTYADPSKPCQILTRYMQRAEDE